MNIIVLGAAGFIGTNLTLELCKQPENCVTVVDRNQEKLELLKGLCSGRLIIKKQDLIRNPVFDHLLRGQDMVYHLISTTVPSISNREISGEINDNVKWMSDLLEACVRCQVKRIIFLSSGGTVYGTRNVCPLHEEMAAYPINSYGMQKLMNEKLLYLYYYIYGLDYRIIRLANPYGPYQRADGIQGVIAAFLNKAMQGEIIPVYGDGTVVRDYLYIDDAVRAIVRIANSTGQGTLFNVGSGEGTSIHQLLEEITCVLKTKLRIRYLPGRAVDVPCNFLDISKYENAFGKLVSVPLREGIEKTIDFMQRRKI